MRLKNINIEERSSIYSLEQKERLKTISNEVNKIGDIFDILVDLEMFVAERIEKPLNNFINIKTNKTKIVEKEGLESYLHYFKIASDDLEKELNDCITSWNELVKENKKEEYTVENIEITIKQFKDLYKFIDSMSSSLKIEGFESLKNIISEFTNFRIYKVLVTKDIIEKLECLIDLKAKLDGKKEVKKLTIDDL